MAVLLVVVDSVEGVVLDENIDSAMEAKGSSTHIGCDLLKPVTYDILLGGGAEFWVDVDCTRDCQRAEVVQWNIEALAVFDVEKRPRDGPVVAHCVVVEVEADEVKEAQASHSADEGAAHDSNHFVWGLDTHISRCPFVVSEDAVVDLKIGALNGVDAP